MHSVIRALLVVLVLLLAGFLLMGYWPLSLRRNVDERTPTVGTTGTIDKDKARERGAEFGEKVAVAAEKIQHTAHEAAITTKIKAKMALDDSVKARRIDVSTDGTTVIVAGTVGSDREHDRALALARETEGVSTVIDRLVISH
jgi:hyperosmotically inducible protein